MNREQKRNLEKTARKKGLSVDQAKLYAKLMANADEIRKNGAGETSPSQEIQEGAKVKINVDLVKSRQNYPRMSEKYREMIEAEEFDPKEYTAHIEASNMISLVEIPNWLFWSGDLIVCSDDGPGTKE